jgi:hypothetical protein
MKHFKRREGERFENIVSAQRTRREENTKKEGEKI